MQHRGVLQQWCLGLDKSEQNVGLQKVPLHESQWEGSTMQCQRVSKICQACAARQNAPDDVCFIVTWYLKDAFIRDVIMMHCRGADVIATGLIINFVAMTSDVRCLMS
jgi:hypothetical protein